MLYTSDCDAYSPMGKVLLATELWAQAPTRVTFFKICDYIRNKYYSKDNKLISEQII